MKTCRNRTLALRALALALILALLTGAASAASWREGTGPEKPYLGKPAVNLDRTLGYYMLYPQAGFAAQYYCDCLTVYLPREDVTVGAGEMNLYAPDGSLLFNVNVAENNAAVVEPMTEIELDSLMWGSGVAYRIRLPFSLPALGAGEAYTATLDDGAILAAGGAVGSAALGVKEPWVIAVQGDYCIGGLSYREGRSTNLADVGPESPIETGETPLTFDPKQGDTVSFDILLGGDAVSAVIYDPEGCLSFPQTTYTAEDKDTNGTIRAEGVITGAALGSWGVIFQDAEDEPLQIVMVRGLMPAD